MTEEELIKEIKAITPKKFYASIMYLVENHDLTILEAIDEFTKNYRILSEDAVASLIMKTPTFKAKLQEECELMNTVDKEDSRIF